MVDETLAAAARATGAPLPDLFLALYALTLVTVALGATALSRALGASPWMTALFLGLLTLRHRIAKTGANTLEGYMHPRMLAFGVGLFVLAAACRRRWALAASLWLLAAVIHPTTALWFAAAVVGGLAAPWLAPRAGAWVAGLSVAALAGGTLLAGALSRLPVPAALHMDAAWTTVFADKDYLFASTWPPYAWALNLAYAPIALRIYRQRQSAGAATPGDTRLIGGAVVLLGLFTGAVWLTEAHVALAVQLQVSRVFWLIDMFVTLYAAWWLTDRPAVSRRARIWALTAVAALALGRGVYTLAVAPDDRAFARRDMAPSDWSDTMRWLRTQPSGWLVLAHPDHAWLYGSSVRVAAGRDVVVESVKDSAIAMYDRDTALRVAAQLSALARFDTLTADDARALGGATGATVLVTSAAPRLALPVLHANGRFAVYDLR